MLTDKNKKIERWFSITPKKKLICIAIILLLVVLGIGAYLAFSRYKKPVVSVSVPQKTVDCSFSESDMLKMINEVRTNKLSLSNELEVITQKRADTLPIQLDDHKGFRELLNSGKFPPKFTYLGEILASNTCPATKQIFTQWKNSPKHWSAITNERYDVLGIGFNGQSAVIIFGDLQ